ncbi:hypothetical protein [Nocardia sp. NPDC006630]|uniref:hypothetical protein n=1 Tax=Nocardia sp. NPDC006630 TaxID=3157181 RepID=UPI0033BF24E0
MSWSIVGPLVGVAIGTVGTLTAQFMAMHTNSALSRASHRLTLRADRRDAIYAFLDAAQVADEVADLKHLGKGFDENQAREAMHQTWFRYKCIEVIGSAELRSRALAYTFRMNESVWGDLPTGQTVWTFMKEHREPFLEAARVELDASDLSVVRRRPWPFRRALATSTTSRDRPVPDLS